MQSGPSYPRQPSNMQVVLGHPPPSCPPAVTRPQQQRDPSSILYDAVPRYFSDGEDVVRQHRTILPLTYNRPMILREYDRHSPNHLTRISALVPPSGTFRTQDYTPHPQYVADDAEYAGQWHHKGINNEFPSVQPLPNAHPLPHPHAGILSQMHSENVPPFKPPPHDACYRSIDVTVQIGVPARAAQCGHASSLNLNTLGGPLGHRNEQTFGGPNGSLSLLSSMAPPSGDVPTGCVPPPASPPVSPSIVGKTASNAEPIPLPFYHNVLQPVGGNSHEGMDQASSRMITLSSSNGPWYQGPSYTVGTQATPTPLMYDVASPTTAAVFSYQDPAYPAPSQGYLEPIDGDASAVIASDSPVAASTTANTAPFPVETSQLHPLPPQLTNSASPEAPQVTSQVLGDLRPCVWKDNHGHECGELLGWDCQGHLAFAHGITNMAGSTLVTCGACDRQLKRESFLRHYRVRDLGFPRRG
ncbi:hypothetical protein EDC04DRAFT_951382 [Pisolithus marmoratus]|nr:hypothetical protein EDC04DRAFT_951382 [Pisolithus marmoratus]